MISTFCISCPESKANSGRGPLAPESSSDSIGETRFGSWIQKPEPNSVFEFGAEGSEKIQATAVYPTHIGGPGRRLTSAGLHGVSDRRAWTARRTRVQKGGHGNRRVSLGRTILSSALSVFRGRVVLKIKKPDVSTRLFKITKCDS